MISGHAKKAQIYCCTLQIEIECGIKSDQFTHPMWLNTFLLRCIHSILMNVYEKWDIVKDIPWTLQSKFSSQELCSNEEDAPFVKNNIIIWYQGYICLGRRGCGSAARLPEQDVGRGVERVHQRVHGVLVPPRGPPLGRIQVITTRRRRLRGVRTEFLGHCCVRSADER